MNYLNPLITYTYKRIYPYLVLTIMIFLLTFISCIINIDNFDKKNIKIKIWKIYLN